MRWTIRRKLLVSIGVPLLVTYLLILYLDYQRQRENAVRFMQDMVLTRARLTAGMINTRMEQAQQMARTLANNIANRPGALVMRSGALALPRQGEEWVLALVVSMEKAEAWESPPSSHVSRGFMVRRFGRGPRGEGLRELPSSFDLSVEGSQFAGVLATEKEGWIGPQRLPGVTRGEAAIYAVPMRTRDGNRGVAAVVVPIGFMRRAANPMAQLLEDLEEPQVSDTSAAKPVGPVETATSLLSEPINDFVVLNAQGGFVYHPSDQAMGRVPFAGRGDVPPEVMAGYSKALAGESSISRAEGLGRLIPGYSVDEDYWMAFVPIPSTGWIFVTAASETQLMQPLLRLIAERAALLLGGLAVMLGCVYFVTVRFSRPIERLAGALRKVGEGDLQVQVPLRPRSQDEVVELSRGFNAMVGQIRRQMEHIQQVTEQRAKAQSELQVARMIQADLLPQKFPPFPERSEFSLHAVNRPAAHVAGDFYDFFFVDERRLMLIIADVAGKGVPAAILMAVTRTMIRNLAMMGKNPLDIVKYANQALYEQSPVEMFVTMMVCEYDTVSGEMVYVNAGHCYPVVVGREGKARVIRGSNSPLVGASVNWPADEFTEARLQLAPGETLVMYTDGVTEARNAAGEMLLERGLVGLLEQNAGSTPQEICRVLSDPANLPEVQDDLTLLVLRRE